MLHIPLDSPLNSGQDPSKQAATKTRPMCEGKTKAGLQLLAWDMPARLHNKSIIIAGTVCIAFFGLVQLSNVSCPIELLRSEQTLNIP